MFKLSVVIATCNRPKDLKTLLLSLSFQQFYPTDIIVVDDSKSPFTFQLVESFVSRFKFANCALKYVRGPGSGLATARNIGIRHCEGDFVLFLDDDTEVEPSCLLELVTAMAFDSSVGAAQAKLLQMEKRDTLDCAGGFLNVIGFGDEIGSNEKDSGQYDYCYEISYAKGAAIIVRKAIWATLKGFDPLFSFYSEESDFCWRVWLSGYRVVFVPSAKVFHVGGATKGQGDIYSINSRFLSFRNRIIMVIKNLELKNLIKYFPWLFSMQLYLILLDFRRNRCGSVLGNFLGIIWNLRFFKLVWSQRLITQRMRHTNDSNLLKRRVIYATIFI